MLQSRAEDHPLIVQICGNDPDVMGPAAAAVEQFCNTHLHGLEAIDINLGCPQKRHQPSPHVKHASSQLRGADLLRGAAQSAGAAVRVISA
eukprot:3934335-Rhodomonas_salina.4